MKNVEEVFARDATPEERERWKGQGASEEQICADPPPPGCVDPFLDVAHKWEVVLG